MIYCYLEKYLRMTQQPRGEIRYLRWLLDMPLQQRLERLHQIYPQLEHKSFVQERGNRHES
ncbi:hypothetical protein [Dongshaea marina]|uniref:hypothetical protein n=1 Tax=Dongshaea marina TaxID=2047966 RepID=UPI000D3E61C4|nr:hypothetical protein [Dongshaea marina]